MSLLARDKIKYIYSFDEADWRNKKLLGGKGASLAQMTQLNFPVPPGFTITTEACREFYKPVKKEIDRLVRKLETIIDPRERDRIIKEIWSLIDKLKLPDGLMDQVREYIRRLEDRMGRKFGDKDNPLLVSVRSGAPISMPGMMDTILNLGLNDDTVLGLAKQTGNLRFAYDSYRRFLQLFGKIVLEIDSDLFDKVLDEVKTKYRVKEDIDLPVNALKEIVAKYKEIIISKYGCFPSDPWIQLEMAIKAVFRSWMNPRAIMYRIMNKINPEVADCTAVNIQAMVFGNLSVDSGTGVVFSRDVATGENKLYGEFLPNAQGEDVVAGVRTPMGIDELKARFPKLYNELYEKVKLLERVNKEVQDVEFTVEAGKLYFLQTRAAKMTPLARVKTAVDMAKEGIISKEEAVLKVKPEHVQQLLYPRIDPEVKTKPIAKGLNASPGAVSGQVVFDPDTAVAWAREGKDVILVRIETKPDDVHGFYAAKGILTSRGGMTSHAAVVARGIGKPAVVGAEEIRIDYEKKIFEVNGLIVKEGDWITIDGSTGYVYYGRIPTIAPEVIPELDELLKWADEFRRLGVKANADLPEDVEIARKYGAEGIGLLRIERMFRRPDRLEVLKKIILSTDVSVREKYIRILIKLVKPDFKRILEIMDGRPVIIRLIDPPLHEFLPKPAEILTEIYKLKSSNADRSRIEELERLYKRVCELIEDNPMMGHRGVRVGVTYPEIYKGLAVAIFEATAELIKEGKNPFLEIMIPQVSIAEELRYVKENAIYPALKEVERKYGVKIKFKIGSMIETVRACITADEIAKEVDFFSFGTNDLTQAVYSFSRDDAENKFIPRYLELGILKNDPFQILDEKGVGELIKMAIERGKKANPNLEIGICGEHGGNPESIKFFHKVGLDYVSASPYRILIARLVAAQAAIKSKN